MVWPWQRFPRGAVAAHPWEARLDEVWSNLVGGKVSLPLAGGGGSLPTQTTVCFYGSMINVSLG